MSYILEALKKSDQQRQQEHVPDLNTVQAELPSGKKKKPSWLYLLGAILLMNAFILFVVIMRQDQPATEPEAVVPSSDRQKSATVQKKQNDIVPQPAQAHSPVITEPPPADHAATVDDKNSVVSLEESSAAPVVQARDTVKTEDKITSGINIAGGQEEDTHKETAEATSTIAPQENFDIATELESVETATLPEEQYANPEINLAQQALLAEPETSTFIARKLSSSRNPIQIYQLPESIREQLPEIHISAHAFYKNKPSARFASINGKIMREGHTLAPDLTVAEISPEGVIFSYQKYLFHVSVF